jgi:cation transport regulator ChaC
METMLYFSYGSNMSTPRLKERVPSARAIAVARLHKHRLKFHKKSKDNSGKCDAECTNDEKDVVYGVVFEIAASEKPELDKHEGLKNGYEEKSVSVNTDDGKELKAVTYYATNVDSKLKPYEWYKEHVIRGAHEHGLPAKYISTISAVEAMPDPDKSRHERELSIYR